MEITEILGFYEADPRTKALIQDLEEPILTRHHLKGMMGAMEAFVTAASFKVYPHTQLIILDNKENAAYFHNDLKTILNRKDILFFPDSFKKPSYLEAINKSNVLLRTETVSKLMNSATSGEILVTYPQALFEKVVNIQALEANIIKIKINEEIDLDFIIELLVEVGFEATDFVYEPGQFSVRGGIVDIFSFGHELPYRVELFGDEVESIRTFDPVSQLSKQKIAQITIVPNIQTEFNSGEKTSLLNLLPENTSIWIKDTVALRGLVDECYKKALDLIEYHDESTLDESLQENPIFESKENHAFQDADTLFRDIVNFDLIEFGSKAVFDSKEIVYNASPQPPFQKKFDMLNEDLQININRGYINFILASASRQIKRFQNIFEDNEYPLNYKAILGSVSSGFVDNDLKLACYTDHQIFDRYYKFNIKQAFSKQKAMSIRLLRELQPGDYVTHIDHGIGKFSGLETLDINGKKQETMRLIYRDNDLLYVSIHSLHKVSKYVGKEGKVPKINKLGSDSWQKLKRKTKSKLKDIAADLIKLYAKRKGSKGFAYSPDSYLQTELEASFIYEDTPDQHRASEAVKADMEAENPMDRLVCGDVGFGKTEVAIRAAAKAVVDGKQVAVLVPTTILALQHYKTFSERLKDYPCTIDYINRFKTAKQKKLTLEKLEKGEIDIVIGTHGLTGKSVKFKDLGLLIIDEEQKFGVGVKEKLRNMKVNVDTLTLTATPIPRTLQFSLMSARDLSIIRTAPPNRQPVNTELIQFNSEKIRDAITYEVYRGGQVFFVHNRVRDISDIAAMITRLCPDVDVGIAHGQMENKKLEEQMFKFEKGEFDVLVSTNIIEAGLDIPNANTMIINNAHHFGLSDLHQMRGRVGRSNKKAFCYLISPPVFGLPEDSRKRLLTIEQFADLGSGFNIAMKDLDIRGAGNILGAEQSGFIADIGFETYQKILKEAVLELKETEFKEVFEAQEKHNSEFRYVHDTQIDTDLDLLIPNNYVNNVNERMALYTELNNIEKEEDLMKFKENLVDRFGALPKEVNELIYGVRLKWVSCKIGFERLILKNNKLRCFFPMNHDSPYYNSPVYSRLMSVLLQRKDCKMHQTTKYFSVIFEHISSIKQARNKLLELEVGVGNIEIH